LQKIVFTSWCKNWKRSALCRQRKDWKSVKTGYDHRLTDNCIYCADASKGGVQDCSTFTRKVSHTPFRQPVLTNRSSVQCHTYHETNLLF